MTCKVCQWLRLLANWLEGTSKQTQPMLAPSSERVQEAVAEIAKYQEASRAARTGLEEIARHPFPLELLLSRIRGGEVKVVGVK